MLKLRELTKAGGPRLAYIYSQKSHSEANTGLFKLSLQKSEDG